MFDIGMVELLVIGVVALIVVGPKDLPGMFRTLGKFTARARSMAREFQRSMEDAADESGMGDIAADLKKVTSARNLGLDSVKDSLKDVAMASFDEDESRKKIEAAKKVDKAGANTKALAAKRAAAKAKATDKAAELAKNSKADAEVGKADAKAPAKKKPAAKKTTAKKSAAKPAAVKTTAAKKPAAKKAATKKPAVKKPAARKPAVKAKS